MNFKSSLLLIKITQLNFRNVLVDVIGHFTKWSTKKQNHLIQVLLPLINYLRIIVGKKNVTIYPRLEKMIFPGVIQQ